MGHTEELGLILDSVVTGERWKNRSWWKWPSTHWKEWIGGAGSRAQRRGVSSITGLRVRPSLRKGSRRKDRQTSHSREKAGGGRGHWKSPGCYFEISSFFFKSNLILIK